LTIVALSRGSQPADETPVVARFVSSRLRCFAASARQARAPLGRPHKSPFPPTRSAPASPVPGAGSRKRMARETLLDLWARWAAWLDKYVKNPQKTETKAEADAKK
jgi:hypothetical protein